MNYLLFQVRKPDDPMRAHEVECFAREIDCPRSGISVMDLTSETPSDAQIDAADVVLLGGSGDYSVTEEYPWLESAFDVLRDLHARSKPTFASCWGFQAFAKALGGDVVTDLSRAELGTLRFHLTDAGKQDPVFSALGGTFAAQCGHQDIVESLPKDGVLLASTSKVENQAFRFRNKPIYCTQFHPELTKNDLLVRLENYPQYVESIVGLPIDVFERSCYETEAASEILRSFVAMVQSLLQSQNP